MRKCIIMSLCVSLFIVNTGYCASIGDPIEALGNNKILVSAEQNLVFSREIEYGQFRQADLKDAYQWYAKGAYGIGEYINVYGKLGMSDLEHKFREGTNDFDIEYDLGPLWGIGALAATPRWHGLNLGLDLQYAGWYVDVESLKYNQERAAQEVGEVLVTELQGTLFLSYKIPCGDGAELIPYAGLSWLYLNNETKETIEYTTVQRSGTIDFDLDNTEDLLLIIGADFVAGENVSLTIEGTVLYDNRGLMVAFSYRF